MTITIIGLTILRAALLVVALAKTAQILWAIAHDISISEGAAWVPWVSWALFAVSMGWLS